MGVLIDTTILMEIYDKKKEIELPDDCYISIVTLFEFLLGKNLYFDWKINMEEGFNVIPLENKIILKAVEIFRKLKKKGRFVSLLDYIIAATALVYDLELWTKDKDFLTISKEFSKLKLKIL